MEEAEGHHGFLAREEARDEAAGRHEVFVEEEGEEAEGADGDGGDDCGGAPGVGGAAPGCAEDDEGDACDEEDEAAEIEGGEFVEETVEAAGYIAWGGADQIMPEKHEDGDHGASGDGDVEDETPAPV